MPKKKATPKSIKKHWERVSDLGCIITGSPYPTLHHIKGGSVRELGIYKSASQKTSDWLVIPLRYDYHMGDMGIDTGQPWLTVWDWENSFGTQVELMDKVCQKLGYNCWAKAGVDRIVAGLK